jgi:hypothetical protein
MIPPIRRRSFPRSDMRQRSRPLRSRTLAAGFSPTRNSAYSASASAMRRGGRPTFTKSPGLRYSIRAA